MEFVVTRFWIRMNGQHNAKYNPNQRLHLASLCDLAPWSILAWSCLYLLRAGREHFMETRGVYEGMGRT